MIDKRSTKAYKLEKENRELKKEIERLKKREQECIYHYLVQCKYASEMEDKYIIANNIINKATEEIKRVLDIWENKPNEIATLDLEYLLNILQGSDK